MNIPSLVDYPTVDEYEQHYYREYCSGPIITFDGIPVTFRRARFWHAFFESSGPEKTKDKFCRSRAQRIEWIEYALRCQSGELHKGWVKGKGITSKRRTTVVNGNYVVVIALRYTKECKLVGDFITAFVAEGSTLTKIRNSPKWQ